MQFSTSDKALYVKVVYYGPGLSGKTTNLETLHRLTDPETRQPLVSLKTEGDRTLFFDLLPFDLGQLFGLDVRLKLYTVPGQVQYDITRRQVLSGADGVVFVADSQRKQFDANLQMIKILKSNLRMNGLDPNSIPLVFQWNKQDLPDLVPVSELARELNFRADAPGLEAVATIGTGVIETFREISLLTLESVANKGSAHGIRVPFSGIRDKVNSIFKEIAAKAKQLAAQPAASKPAAGSIINPMNNSRSAAGRDRTGEKVLDEVELLFDAVQATIDMSERVASTASAESLQTRLRRERKALMRLVQVASVSSEVDSVLRIAGSSLLSGLDLACGSALLSAGKNQPMREIAVHGIGQDPLNDIVTPGIGSVATTLLEKSQPSICRDIAGELLFGAHHAALDGVRSVLIVPIKGGKQDGMLLLYQLAGSREFDDDDLEYATLIGNLVTTLSKGTPARV